MEFREKTKLPHKGIKEIAEMLLMMLWSAARDRAGDGSSQQKTTIEEWMAMLEKGI